MAHTQAITNSSLHSLRIEPAPHDATLAHMERVNQVVDNRMGVDLSSAPLRNVEPHLQREALQIIDRMQEKLKQPRQSWRLASLMERVSDVRDRHMFQKQGKDRSKKREAEEAVDEQKMYRNNQAWAHGIGGFGGLFLQVAGAAISGPVGQISSQLAQSVSQYFATQMGAQELTPQHAVQVILSELQSSRESARTFSELDKEMRDLIRRLVEIDVQAATGIFRG